MKATVTRIEGAENTELVRVHYQTPDGGDASVPYAKGSVQIPNVGDEITVGEEEKAPEPEKAHKKTSDDAQSGKRPY